MKKLPFEYLRSEKHVGEVVEFSKSTVRNGAHGCQFTDCRILLDGKGVPAGLGAVRFGFSLSSFERCSVEARTVVRRLDFTGRVRFNDCTFVGGPFIEPVFGVDPHSDDPIDPEPPVLNCDFLQADLRDARFHGTDVRDVKLRGWPYITAVARDGTSEYAPPSRRRPALGLLVDEVEDFDWGDPALARSVRLLVFSVGLRRHQASIQVCHAGDLLAYARASEDSEGALKTALERFGHPAIRF
jgi:hypothetical protein